VGEQEGYVTVGLYEEGLPGEIFVNISKEGSTIRGLMDSVALLTSVALQYGVPLESLVTKFRGVHFEPAGLTSNRQIPVASSIVDYIFRWLELRFLLSADDDISVRAKATLELPSPKRASTKRGSKGTKKANATGRMPTTTSPTAATTPSDRLGSERSRPRTAPTLLDATSTGLGCPECGSILVYTEGCLVCPSCGYTRC
jgi:ribonucleoside-diphosphate reductase alpha chain